MPRSSRRAEGGTESDTEISRRLAEQIAPLIAEQQALGAALWEHAHETGDPSWLPKPPAIDWGKESPLLPMSLAAAVPLWIDQLKNRSWTEIASIAAGAVDVIAEQGDAILFREKPKRCGKAELGTNDRVGTAEAFNTLARGIACLSFRPGGVDVFGMHFEAKHEGGG